MTLFTFIGCEQSPISPITETNYSVTVGERQTENVIASIAESNNNNNLIAILNCLNLSRNQWVYITGLIQEEKSSVDVIKRKYIAQIDSLSKHNKIQSDSLKIVLSPEEYSTRIDEMNKSFTQQRKQILSKLNIIIETRKESLYFSIRIKLTPEQRIIWDEWIITGKVKCSQAKS
jgi:hypothetical protein